MLKIELFYNISMQQLEVSVNEFLAKLQRNVVERPDSMPNIPQWHLQMASDEKGTTIMVVYWDKQTSNEQTTNTGKD
jgi:hypothetical protein